MDPQATQATIDSLRWWSQALLWMAVGFPICGAIAGGLLAYIDQRERQLSAGLRAQEDTNRDQRLQETQTELRTKTQAYETDLAAKAHQITELEEIAKRLRQGRTVAYAPNGEKTVTKKPGVLVHFADNPEVQVFKQMAILQEQQNFPGLHALAEAQIAKTGPDWLSPYLFQGVALIHLGSKEEGIKVLRFVVREASDNEEFYQQAAELLRKIGAEP